MLTSKGLLLLTAAWTLILIVKAQPSPTSPPVLPYISLGSTAGVQREYVGHFDDGVSHAIHIPGGFPFGNLIHSFAYVGTNGMISFSEPIYALITAPFPDGAPGAYVVAPYWDDVDLRRAGNISYEVHSRNGNNPGSNQLLDEVSGFVENSTGQSFQGSWMLVAEWENVHPWPHGNSLWAILYPETSLMNTWQGLVITDGTNSYTVFIYRCGDMAWTSYFPVIGFNAAGSSFANHPNTGNSSAEEIACVNSPDSQWYNLVYQISLPNATNQTSLPTIESPQRSYLSFLEFTNSTVTSGTLPPCQNCTIGVTVPDNGFPFGSYYHSTIYIGINGIFSFGREFCQDYPKPFLLSDNTVLFSYLVAPYWSNIDTRLDGHVNYEVHMSGESSMSDDYLSHVSSLINSEEDSDFVGGWMIVATWDSVHPYPHGSSAEQDRVDPYLQSINTFQGILITNGTQSYSVFTYECDQMEWSDEATIGYNAGGEYTASHPLSGTLLANAVDCLHSNINVTVNNVIFKLVPGVLITGPPPPPLSLAYLPLRTTPGVVTFTVPRVDDGHSSPIYIPIGFPIGNDKLFDVFVGTNGVISFQEGFTHHDPSLFPSETTFISSAFLLAPFWSDINPTIYGSILYEIHDQSNSVLLSQVNDFISNYTRSAFTGTWMLVAQWNEVVEFRTTSPTNTFQAIAITDGSQSYAVYTYRCGDLQWSGGATIGYNGGPVGDFYANHPLSGLNARHIACLNDHISEWTNIVYNISCYACIPTEPPPLVEPIQQVYLEFLERTSSSITMPNCDDCHSGAIDLSIIPVPFGDYLHFVAYISTNGVISFGHPFSHYGATLFPNEGDSTVFTAFLAAPYWGDIDNRDLGEIWYETHTSGLSVISDSLLERVSNLVKSEQNLTSFQGIWMVVATWNGSVPFAGTGSVSNTFQGIVITNRSKTYAVYTYHCDDMQWSDGSVIGFNAGGSYYANHPLSDSIEACDIDCVHSPGSEWNNVVYDLTPNTEIIAPTTLTSTSEVISEPTTPPLTSTQPTTPLTTPPIAPHMYTSQPTAPTPTPPTTPHMYTSQPTAPPTTLPTLSVDDLSAIAPKDSDTKLIVSWSLPGSLHRDVNINQYYVMVTNYSLEFVATKTIPANKTSANITGLGPFIPYNITVIIQFAFGDGPPTSILNFTRQGVPPVSPSNIKVEKIDSGAKVNVSWDRLTPEEAWGFVTNYIVSYKKEQSESQKRQTSEKVVPGTESSTIIEDLDPNQEYSVSVQADTEVGMGKISEPVSTKSSTASNIGVDRAGVSGAAVAGGLIALAVALILIALAILFAAWVIKNKNSAKESHLLETDLVLENQSNKTSVCITTVDAAPSYLNPLYGTDDATEDSVMIDVVRQTNGPTYEDIKPSQCEVSISRKQFKID